MGDFDVLAYSMGATAGTYSFGSITSATGQFLLVDATIYAGCGEYGNVPPVGTDTIWTLIVSDVSEGGTVQPVSQADDVTGGGGATGSDVCVELVGTDEFGDIIYDDNGDPLVLEDLGCYAT